MKASDRKNLDWHALAQEFCNMVKDTTPETAVYVEVTKNINGKDGGFEVIPAESNYSGTCFCLEEVVDFARCKGLSCYVSAYTGKAVARIF